MITSACDPAGPSGSLVTTWADPSWVGPGITNVPMTFAVSDADLRELAPVGANLFFRPACFSLSTAATTDLPNLGSIDPKLSFGRPARINGATWPF